MAIHDDPEGVPVTINATRWRSQRRTAVIGSATSAARAMRWRGQALIFRSSPTSTVPDLPRHQGPREIIAAVQGHPPDFRRDPGDISAPRCFEIEAAEADLDIPVLPTPTSTAPRSSRSPR